MEELIKTVVEKLKEECNSEKQIKILQNINTLLITDYEFRIDEDIIKPLWIEAYYYKENKFEDDNTHKDKKQKGDDRFGKLYFHEKGRGGVDICLSCGNYYLSFLIKYACVNGVFKSQTSLYSYLLKKYKKEYAENLFVLEKIPEDEKNHTEIFYSIRKGLTKKSFKYEELAALTGINNKEYRFCYATGFGKEKIMTDYMKTHPSEDTLEKWKDLLGWIPRKVRERCK